jgi:ubiquinol-cytochrome c reductase cytochrome b subunit
VLTVFDNVIKIEDLFLILSFYAILRSIPDKLGGVAAMGGALVILFAIPFINTSEIRSSQFRPLFRGFFWLLVIDFLILGWIGQKPVETPFIEVGQLATVFYFVFFMVLIPFLGTFESYLIRIKTDK